MLVDEVEPFEDTQDLQAKLGGGCFGVHLLQRRLEGLLRQRCGHHLPPETIVALLQYLSFYHKLVIDVNASGLGLRVCEVEQVLNERVYQPEMLFLLLRDRAGL